MEPEILEQRHLAIAKVLDDFTRTVSDAVVGEAHLTVVEKLSKPNGNRLERKLGHDLALGPAEVPSTGR
jgi:hypothetical protein